MAPDWSSYAASFRAGLLDEVVPFWERHSPDREHGGYFTCLERDGTVYDTDKFVWLQARQVWQFAMLHERLEARDEWLELARLGADFLRRHAFDDDINWYFSLTRQGTPLIQPCNIFSDCFGAMAFSQYARVAGDDEAKALARRTYDNILKRQDDPKGRWNKAVPGTRPMKTLAMPMILANLSLELEWLLEDDVLEPALDHCVEQVFGDFTDADTGLLRENVAPDGSLIDCFEGRLLNPGHGLEAMWFLMDIGQRRSDRALIDRCVDTALRIFEHGWDTEHGGLFYFLDAHGHPPQQLEWDQKLWWVHLETMVTFLMGHRLTGRADCAEAFGRVFDWAWERFRDPDHGEWFGYLDRRGEVLLSLKGGKWKGCFHVPRGLYLCMRECEALAAA